MSKPQSLLQKTTRLANLRTAWKELNKSNKSSHGLSLETIKSFSTKLDYNLSQIRKELKCNNYSFSSVRAYVHKKKKLSGKIKKRGIRISEIRDRVTQRAIARIIEPILDKKLKLQNEASFAYLKGKKRGTRAALKRMISLYKEKKPVVFEADIKNFFDTVNQDKLLNEMIFPSLPDPSLNELIKQSLTQEIGNIKALDKNDWELFPESGIPQGGALSPLFSNVYLSKFDKEMLSKEFGLVRFADDFIVVCKNEEEANNAYLLAKEILSKLELKIHEKSDDKDAKTRIIRITQKNFEFLGVKYNGKYLEPGRKALQNIRMRIKEITEFDASKNLPLVLSKMKYMIEGWISAYSYTYLEPYLQKIEDIINERVGICAWKMNWIPKRKSLSPQQRQFSGIPRLLSCLKHQRENLSDKDKTIFGIIS